jgi:hypothetical protein
VLLSSSVLVGTSGNVLPFQNVYSVTPVGVSSLDTIFNNTQTDNEGVKVNHSILNLVGGNISAEPTPKGFVKLQRSWKPSKKTAVTSSSKGSDSSTTKQSSSSVLPNIANQVKVTAHNALEKHLAVKMLNVDETISLTGFEQAKSFDTMVDALEKVMYQNPLILGVDSFMYDPSSGKLRIEYADDVQTTKEKQLETLSVAKKLKSKIIKPGMSQGQKEFSIYNYMDKNTKYDDNASISAEDNLFKAVDSEYNDSFTTYGILVKGTGVCMSYTGAFKLLADLSGLDTIVVTGALEGTPHTWMKVKIDSKWYNVDPTNNNTNTGMPYILYNSTDKQARELGYVQDKAFWTDINIPYYVSTDTSKDYYVQKRLEVTSLSEFRTKFTQSVKQGKKKLFFRDIKGLSTDSLNNVITSVLNSELKGKSWNANMYELGNYIGIEYN